MTKVLIRKLDLVTAGVPAPFTAWLYRDDEADPQFWIEIEITRTAEFTRLAEFDGLTQALKSWNQLIEQAPTMLGAQPCSP